MSPFGGQIVGRGYLLTSYILSERIKHRQTSPNTAAPTDLILYVPAEHLLFSNVVHVVSLTARLQVRTQITAFSVVHDHAQDKSVEEAFPIAHNVRMRELGQKISFISGLCATTDGETGEEIRGGLCLLFCCRLALRYIVHGRICDLGLTAGATLEKI